MTTKKKPTRPATKAPTLAECRRLAEECGCDFDSTRLRSYGADGKPQWRYWLVEAWDGPLVISTQARSRSTALRMLHAALLEMKAGRK
jgi:hypothetical protein